MMPGWLLRAVVAADLMRLVALLSFTHSFLYPDAPNFFAQKKIAPSSRPIGSVTRSLDSFPPSPSLSREGHRKKDSRVGG